MNELGTLADGNEVIQGLNRIAFIAIGPFVVDQDDIVKFEALLAHVQEPHAHCARPHHQTHELAVLSNLIVASADHVG
jgi:hypothetical protein